MLEPGAFPHRPDHVELRTHIWWVFLAGAWLTKVKTAGPSSVFGVDRGFAVVQDAVAAVDADAHQLVLASGDRVVYDRLVLVLGAVPRVANEPVLRALLLTGETPRWLRAEGGSSELLSGDAPWWPPHKIATHYLAPYLGGDGRRVAGVGGDVIAPGPGRASAFTRLPEAACADDRRGRRRWTR